MYVYVGNNPLKWTDPWGLAACGDVKRLLMDKAWNIARENVSSKIDV
ncbi:MAG: hypothetical protein LBF15_02390 [Candidatus Peribacteria bacterium]|nr:hypothetical protein [Candidatus Peribacteria bacterium]